MTTGESVEFERYAELLITVGVNVQPGQPVVIDVGSEMSPVTFDIAPFVHALTRRAYMAGAGYVHVRWYDPEISRLTVQYAAEDRAAHYAEGQSEWLMQLVAQGASFIELHCPDPSALAGLEAQRLALYAHRRALALRPVSEALGAFAVRWVVASVPTRPWASLVFPDLPTDVAMAHMWDMVVRATLLDAADPTAAWRRHLTQLSERREWLNRARLRALLYRAPGTDLRVELLPASRWLSGAAIARDGIVCVPNMPTQEVFTTPRRDGAHGTVRCSFPLYHNGVLINDISLRFDAGKIVEATAGSGLEVLSSTLDTDEGARFLGEVSLVPADSSIAQLQTVFYNTLFDENASCHLAFGQGYPGGVENGEQLEAAQLAALGVNQSAVHVDVMIGSDQLEVDGESESGTIVPLLRQGRWAFPLPHDSGGRDYTSD